ncbi:hypothetical protein D5086_027046 [Populus alba]|uniref:Uncharacterized protein n=1 Tax=Populus alba TaxID=43335 RepID=A0ACC4B541_POPAL
MDEQEVSSVDNSPFDITRTGSVVYSAGNLPRHRVVACANGERDVVIEMSKRLGFLSGEESEAMLDAHVQAGFYRGTAIL